MATHANDAPKVFKNGQTEGINIKGWKISSAKQEILNTVELEE
jgi:hypothetical protein